MPAWDTGLQTATMAALRQTPYSAKAMGFDVLYMGFAPMRHVGGLPVRVMDLLPSNND